MQMPHCGHAPMAFKFKAAPHWTVIFQYLSNQLPTLFHRTHAGLSPPIRGTHLFTASQAGAPGVERNP